MNVRLTPRGRPNRTVLYGGVGSVQSDGIMLTLSPPWVVARGVARGDFWATPYSAPVIIEPVVLPLKAIAEIAVDDEHGDWW